MTPEDVLEKAIEVLDKYGHVKGDFGDEQKGHCALGAMRTAALGKLFLDTDDIGRFDEELVAFDQAVARLEGQIQKITNIPAHCAPIPTYNDRDETTAEDIKLLMKKAANDG